MDEQQLLMAMMAPDQNRDLGPVAGIDANFEDPTADPWADIARAFSLSPEQVQMLQVPDPQGRSLVDRINELRTVGGVEMGVSGNQITGRVEF